LSLLLIVCAEHLITIAEDGLPPRAVALLITFFSALAGGFTFGAIRHVWPNADPVVAAILAVMIGIQAMFACLLIRDMME
jgi:divalent metal cation (Fe/Co/Zn/Cd) transporter